jgi:hypothetical protein
VYALGHVPVRFDKLQISFDGGFGFGFGFVIKYITTPIIIKDTTPIAIKNILFECFSIY